MQFYWSDIGFKSWLCSVSFKSNAVNFTMWQQWDILPTGGDISLVLETEEMEILRCLRAAVMAATDM